MPKHSKRYNNASVTIDRDEIYGPDQAIELIKDSSKAKFEAHCSTNYYEIDPQDGFAFIEYLFNVIQKEGDSDSERAYGGGSAHALCAAYMSRGMNE
mgnify:CR=1 FL=1